jgi:hypothetical protein
MVVSNAAVRTVACAADAAQGMARKIPMVEKNVCKSVLLTLLV